MDPERSMTANRELVVPWSIAPTNSLNVASRSLRNLHLSGLLAGSFAAGPDEQLDDVGTILKQEIDVISFGLRKALEHECCWVLPAGGSADAALEAPESFVAERTDDRADAVVAAGTPALLHPQLGEWEIDVVVDDQDTLEWHPEVRNKRRYGEARLIHEGVRPRQNSSSTADIDLGDLSANARGPLEASLLSAGERLYDVGTEIVPRCRVLLPGIAQPNN